MVTAILTTPRASPDGGPREPRVVVLRGEVNAVFPYIQERLIAEATNVINNREPHSAPTTIKFINESEYREV